MCLPYLIEIKPTPRKNRMRRTTGQPPRSRSSSPPCIITIEPRSPKAKQTDCSPKIGGLRIHGEASLRGKREPCDASLSQPKPHPSPRSHHPSPRSPPHKSPICSDQKPMKSTSSSSSSSSASSKSSFRDLQDKIENLVRRIANVEKDIQAERERADHIASTAVARDSKIEKEIVGLKESIVRVDTRGNTLEKDIAGLKEAVGGIHKEVEALRKDVMWVKEHRERSWDQVPRHGEGSGREGRVRVEWERVRRSPREESRSPRQRQGSR
ncbi:MAG: hypothetical protein Q9215_006219 [Flavoplaca cf. flavocitrina]